MDGGLVTNTVIVNCRANGGSQVGGGMWMVGGTCAASTLRACQGNDGAGVYASGGTIEDCTIRDCISSYIHSSHADNTVLRRCRFFNNSAYYWGGGINLSSGGQMENCLIYSNQIIGSTPLSSATGGGVYMQGGSVVNCTIARNTATGSGGGVQVDGGTMNNSIVYFNTTNGVPNDCAGSLSSISYSCAPELTAGVQGNRTGNPLFKNAAAGNFHLSLGSPCIDTGTNFAGIATLDLDLLPRLRKGKVNMGAYESLPPTGALMIIR